MQFIDDAASAVQFIMSVAFVIMGVSHIVQPRMWVEFFGELHESGTGGVVWRTFLFELWPALLIVGFHQQWSGPALALTVYGWLLLFKCVLAMWAPHLGLRSLAMATSERRFVGAGVGLLILAALSFWASMV